MRLKLTNKQSLNDWPGKIVFPVLIEGCNFKCPYCFLPELVTNFTKEEIKQEELLKKIAELDKTWYDGILISGGEPTIHKELPEFLKKIKDIGFKIRIFTNGSNPNMLKKLIDEKLVDSIAMDVKNTKEKYESTTNSKINIKDLEESMKITASLKDYEFRTTIIRKFHTKEDVVKIFKWISSVIDKKPNYKIQNFYDRAEYIDENMKREEPFQEKEINDIYKDIT
ncbi:MAG: anaerobic ribonucleoside-triphosphate reductase activating protein [Candidatus Nanoarchaeia archaeon]|nr:anaerobic ribonucleoside-triphosphate reductase activating protein [Candidatus Nanoarchaeia archaeon]MDD5588359.1 anaerobic ribonucleoside-triphosphate reductase activating protein [Candidatus Nanoarchaeia archaeon]